MFPYPSGDLHMGHAEAYALGDVVARYWVQRGFNVMHPIGWDAFGLPAENAAIKRGVDPAAWTYENIATQKASMRRYACSFDWDRVLNTCDPEFYRWNQWLFLRMFEKGLAYRKPSQVNWCPNDQTVLANEQVVGGLCERCDTPVTKKKLTQWYFRITDYADRLLDDMAQLEGKWPEKVLLMQRNWIGRSTGADVVFEIEGRAEPVTVYTTRPDTLFGATFFVVAADSDLAAELASGSPPDVQQEFDEYLAQGAADLRDRPAVDRPAEDRRLPAAVRDQPGQRRAAADLRRRLRAGRLRPRRDHGGARARPARPRLRAGLRPAGASRRRHRRGRPSESGVATTGDGRWSTPAPLDGLDKAAAIATIIAELLAKRHGDAAVNYRLRDWLISRQRYWGTPIPIVHCPTAARCRSRTTSCRSCCRRPPGSDLKPKGTSPLGGSHRLGQRPVPDLRGSGEA